MSGKHLYLLVAIAAILGCASSNTTSESQANPSGGYRTRSATLLTAEEIVASNADVESVYNAISRLRPNWLNPHGVTSFSTQGTEFATVYLDGQLYGDLNKLRSLQAYYVAEINYYDVTQAGARFGLKGGVGGVIEVRTK